MTLYRTLRFRCQHQLWLACVHQPDNLAHVYLLNGDSLDSINATSSAIVKYVSQRAGIGINAGRIRALGSPIRNGEAYHTGCIPFYKHFQTAAKSCSQGGVRGGAATLFYPLWHLKLKTSWY